MAERGIKSELDVSDNVDRLLQSLDDIRGGVAALTARFGDEAAAAGSRGMKHARELAGGLAEDWTNRAEEGATALRSRVEEQPIAATALAFFAGLAVGGVLMSAMLSTQRAHSYR